jgi:adenylate kinase
MGIIVIMGVQGCGKGTQAKLLAAEQDLAHVAVGDIFRHHLQSGTMLGRRVREFVDAGKLVPDDLVNEIVAMRLADDDCRRGVILDGYPRTRAQAAQLLARFAVSAVILIEVPDAAVVERVLARRLCRDCGRDTNLIYRPPRVAGRCDDCGGELIARADDNEAALRARLADYHAQTEPVLALFAREALILRVDGRQAVEAVQAAIRAELASVPQPA